MLNERYPVTLPLVCHETFSDKKGERDRTAGGDGSSSRNKLALLSIPGKSNKIRFS